MSNPQVSNTADDYWIPRKPEAAPDIWKDEEDVGDEDFLDTDLLKLTLALSRPPIAKICDFTYWTAQKQLVAQKAAALDGPSTTASKETDEFVMVDSTKVGRPNRGAHQGSSKYYQRPRGRPDARGLQGRSSMTAGGAQQQRAFHRFNPRGGLQTGGKKDKLAAAYQFSRSQAQNVRWNNFRTRAVMAELVTDINPDWETVSEISLQSLAARPMNMKEFVVKDVAWLGKVCAYNSELDKIKSRQPRVIDMPYTALYSHLLPGTRTDPILPELLQTDGEVQVIITDQMLTTLMAAPLSRYGWQLVAYKLDNKVIFDKGDTASSVLDILTINETADNKATEAGPIAAQTNLAFQQMAVDKQKTVVEEEVAQFAEDFVVPPNRLYRYLKIKLPLGRHTPGLSPDHARNKPITILVRCQIDSALVNDKGEVEGYVNIHALNESMTKGAPSVGWANSLEKQKGTLLVTELRNNACKVAKWIYSALIGGVSTIKLGFISRSTDSSLVLLGVHTAKTVQLAQQMSVRVPNAWSAVREIIDTVLSDPHEDGKFFITRDPLNPVLKIHRTDIENDEEEDDGILEEGNDRDEDGDTVNHEDEAETS